MSQFQTVGRFERGYEPYQVDAFLAKAEAAVMARTMSAEVIRKVGFDLVRGGYDVEAVDAHLDRLELQAAEAERKSASPGASGPPAQQLVGLTEVLARPHGGRFPRTGRFRRGYDARAVDRFTDGLAATLAGHSGPGLRSVRTAVFPASLGGYDEDAVDDYLDRVVDVLLRQLPQRR